MALVYTLILMAGLVLAEKHPISGFITVSAAAFMLYINAQRRGGPDMEENKVASDSSAPNSPELTGLSGEQAEERNHD